MNRSSLLKEPSRTVVRSRKAKTTLLLKGDASASLFYFCCPALNKVYTSLEHSGAGERNSTYKNAQCIASGVR